MSQEVTSPLADPENFRQWLLSQPEGAKVGTACPFDGQLCPLDRFLLDSTGMRWIGSRFMYWPEHGKYRFLPEWAERFVRYTDFGGYRLVSREDALTYLDRVLDLCTTLAR